MSMERVAVRWVLNGLVEAFGGGGWISRGRFVSGIYGVWFVVGDGAVVVWGFETLEVWSFLVGCGCAVVGSDGW